MFLESSLHFHFLYCLERTSVFTKSPIAHSIPFIYSLSEEKLYCVWVLQPHLPCYEETKSKQVKSFNLLAREQDENPCFLPPSLCPPNRGWHDSVHMCLKVASVNVYVFDLGCENRLVPLYS